MALDTIGKTADPVETWKKALAGVGNSVREKTDAAQRALVELKEVQSVVVGRFATDIMKTLDLYGRLATKNFNGITFNLGKLFGTQGNELHIKKYLEPFMPPTLKKTTPFDAIQSPDAYPFPLVTLPVVCNIGGRGVTFDSIHQGGQANFATSLLSFTPIGNLPMMVDAKGYAVQGEVTMSSMAQATEAPNVYGFVPDLKDKLLETDEGAASTALRIYRKIAAELNLKGQHFQSPVIGRYLAVIPAPIDGSYVAEFAPQIHQSKQDKEEGRVWLPFAMIGGKRNDCGDYLKYDYSDTARVPLRSPDGKEQLWKVLPVSEESAPFVQKEVKAAGATSLEEVNHAAIFLFPFKKIQHEPDLPLIVNSGTGAGMREWNELQKRQARDQNLGGQGGGNLKGGFGDRSVVSDAAVLPGSTSWLTAQRRDKNYGYELVPDTSAKPAIIMMRFLTVATTEEKTVSE